MFYLRRVAAAAVVTSVIALAGCSEARNDVVSPQQPGAIQLGLVQPGQESADPSVVEGEYFKVCKVWRGVSDPSSFSTSVVINVALAGGGSSGPHNFTLTGDECLDVWINGGSAKDIVTATETPPANFARAAQDREWILDGVTQTPDNGNSGAVDGDSGVLVTWVNELIPTGGEGCTPGYWKNHAGLLKRNGKYQPDAWGPTGFATTDLYDATFGVVSSFGGNLLQALQRGGGGEIALGRHAVAALLSAAHPDVDYDLTVAEVIALVQAAYASGDFETAKNTLASFNEQGCPL
jgi:hypothetical protein